MPLGRSDRRAPGGEFEGRRARRPSTSVRGSRMRKRHAAEGRLSSGEQLPRDAAAMAAGRIPRVPRPHVAGHPPRTRSFATESETGAGRFWQGQVVLHHFSQGRPLPAGNIRHEAGRSRAGARRLPADRQPRAGHFLERARPLARGQRAPVRHRSLPYPPGHQPRQRRLRDDHGARLSPRGEPERRQHA